MFINIGDRFIRTGDIRVIDVKERHITDYQGGTHPVTVDIDKLVADINEDEKNSSGMARLASSIEPIKPQE
jgi:hypothetical protein